MQDRTGIVASLQICPAHRAPMELREQLRATEDHGLEGDRHSGSDTRQVLLMDEETLVSLGLTAGAVKENITTRGLALNELGIGTRLRVGDVLLQLTKACTPCGRMDEIREGLRKALQGRRGMLAAVVEGGEMKVGDSIEVVRE